MFNTINKSNTINTNVKRTPFCKVCIDAGLPKSVYESHWVKTIEGKVCCPTLLEQSCRYCKVKGHTVKFCHLLKQEESNQITSRVNKKTHIIAITPSQSEQNKMNAFSSLYESDTDDDEKPKQKPKQFKKVDIIPSPTPVIISKSPPPIHTKTYASALTTTKPIKQIEPLKSHCISLKHDENNNTVFTNIKIIKNWADYSDSDSDSN